MRTTLSGQRLEVVPDAALLADPETVYPVQIDPSVSAAKAAWAYVDKKSPTVAYYNSTGDARVGYEAEDGTTKRSFFRMNTSAVKGKNILSATLRLVETWAWSCEARKMQVWATNSFSSTTTWNTQPTWAYQQDEKSFAYNWFRSGQASPCPNPAGGVELSVLTQTKNAAASSWTSMTVGIRATSETDTYAFKRFNNNPTLVVTYDTLPSVPTSMTTVPTTPCTGGSIGATDISLRAVPADGDSGTVIARFTYWAAGVTATTKDVSVSSGAPAVLSLGRTLGPGLWSWKVTTLGKDANNVWQPSAPTATCSFTVDLTAPVADVTVTSPNFPDYSETGGTGLAGRLATFTITTAPDVAKVAVGFDRDNPYYRATVVNGTATVSVMPTKTGPQLLHVQTFDAAGNTGGTDSDFDILAMDPATAATPPAAAGDANRDGSPDITRYVANSVTCLYAGNGALATLAFESGSSCSNLIDVTFPVGAKPVDVGDWDGDGDNDAMTLLPSGRLCLWAGNGVGGFETSSTCRELVTGEIDPNTLEPVPFVTTFTEIYGAKDWDDDGDPELGGKTSDGRLWVVENDSGRPNVPAGTPGHLLGTGWSSFHVIFPGDLNGDGQPDVLGRYVDTLYSYLGDTTITTPRLTAGSKLSVGTGWGVYAQLLDIGDWDRDGKADIGAAGTNGELWYYRGRGIQATPFETRVRTGVGWTNNWML